jgi:hypothetical protein
VSKLCAGSIGGKADQIVRNDLAIGGYGSLAGNPSAALRASWREVCNRNRHLSGVPFLLLAPRSAVPRPNLKPLK